jgi:hypothetical protein
MSSLSDEKHWRMTDLSSLAELAIKILVIRVCGNSSEHTLDCAECSASLIHEHCCDTSHSSVEEDAAVHSANANIFQMNYFTKGQQKSM